MEKEVFVTGSKLEILLSNYYTIQTSIRLTVFMYYFLVDLSLARGTHFSKFYYNVLESLVIYTLAMCVSFLH